jgi:hypothetical protein
MAKSDPYRLDNLRALRIAAEALDAARAASEALENALNVLRGADSLDFSPVTDVYFYAEALIEGAAEGDDFENGARRFEATGPDAEAIEATRADSGTLRKLARRGSRSAAAEIVARRAEARAAEAERREEIRREAREEKHHP